MKRILRMLMLLILPFFLWSGNAISANALVIVKEEKELLDMLGAEYELDADGNFVTFKVDQNTLRINDEIKEKLYNRYNGQMNIGNLRLVMGKSHHEGNAWAMEIRYFDEAGSDNILYFDDGTCNVFINPNEEFWNNSYDDDFSTDKPSRYTKGTMVHTENGWNPYEEYQINGKGEYSLQYKRDEKYHYSYDKNGNLLKKRDILEGVTYDGAGNPYTKDLKSTDKYGMFASVPYEVADEVQRLIDENGGSFNIYNEEGGYSMKPEIYELIVDGQMAQKLGLSIEDYRERNEIYKGICTSNACGSCSCLKLAAKASIFKVEPSKFWTPSKPATEYDIPGNISEKGIAEELTKLINDYRVENGLEPLADDSELLQKVADIRAAECVYYMDSYHSRPCTGSASAFDVGENIAQYNVILGSTNESLAQLLFEGWKNSPGHNKNMLNKDYLQGAIGIKFATINGTLFVHASHDFSVSEDYDDTISETVRKRIEIGAQTPENGITSAEDYYRKYYGYEISDLENNSTQQGNSDTSAVNTGGLQVLDESGNKMQLPNGVDWNYARTEFRTYEGLWGPDGCVYNITEGRILFDCVDGNTYGIYIYPEMIDPNDGSGDLIYFLNNISSNKIILKKCEYYTVDMVYPDGYDAKMATRDCYYIMNGEMAVINFGQ